jgi:hypothetical protein
VTDDHETGGPFRGAPEPPAPPSPPDFAFAETSAASLSDPGTRDTPTSAGPTGSQASSDGTAVVRRADSMATPPTERYPGGRPSPPEPVAAERWAFHPDAPPPRPRLRRRLWWVLPFGISLLAGLVFALGCLAYQATGHPGFAGNACMIATIAALLLAWLVATDIGFSGVPTNPVAGTCVALFGVAPAITWILLALR